MKSEDTLKKYIKETFSSNLDICYTSDFTCTIELPDGTIDLLALGYTISVYLNGKLFQVLELKRDGFFYLIPSIYNIH